jgi:hypothetical protein
VEFLVLIFTHHLLWVFFVINLKKLHTTSFYNFFFGTDSLEVQPIRVDDRLYLLFPAHLMLTLLLSLPPCPLSLLLLPPCLHCLPFLLSLKLLPSSYCCSLMSLSSSAPPTQKKAYQALLTQEVNNKLAGLESGCGFTQLINNALHLEHDQYVVG